jgi:hypothetical protein
MICRRAASNLATPFDQAYAAHRGRTFACALRGLEFALGLLV